MRLTDYRTMLYLPHHLYQQSVIAARRQKKSLAAIIREALQLYFKRPRQSDYLEALSAGFGLWKDRTFTGVGYQNKMRAQWKRRGKTSV